MYNSLLVSCVALPASVTRLDFLVDLKNSLLRTSFDRWFATVHMQDHFQKELKEPLNLKYIGKRK